jgi:hypothetical protein
MPINLRQADAVIIGSYVPEGVALSKAVGLVKPKRLCFLRHRHAGDAGESSTAATRNIWRAADADSSTPISPSPAARC